MARTLTITTPAYLNWKIGAEIYPEGKDIYDPWGWFALSQVREGRIEFLFNYDLSDREVELAKCEPLFAEVCDFIHEESGVKFRGTWIDALLFIQKTLREETP